MDVKLTQEAVKDRKKLSKNEWREIKGKVREVTEEKLSHKDLKLIDNQLLKHPVWQLTVDGENTDHRVYIDVRNSQVIVIAIWNFDFTHQGDNHWEELRERV